MRCRSVTGVWPETPPPHRVTAVTVLHQPPSLYTGAADGSVVWWHLSGDRSSKAIKPVAMLCGHAAPIADLCISCPLLATADENSEQHSDGAVKDAHNDQGALISACSDGVLCAWSRGSGHCRRRRKLPPWVGSPSMVQTLPSNRRYICVASCFTEALHTSNPDYKDFSETNEVPGDEESQCKKKPKCTIIIVDSCTLTVVRTVLDGNLSIGPLKYMALVESVDDNKKHSALVVDSSGKIQSIPLDKDSNLDNRDGSKLHENSSLMNSAAFGNRTGEGGVIVSVATCGKILGLVSKTRSIFMLVSSTKVIGEIYLENSALCCRDSTSSHVAGGMFISSDNTCTSKYEKSHDMIDVKFAIWNDRGFAITYRILYRDDTFKSEVMHEVPAISCPSGVKLSTHFVQLSDYLLRVESICFHDEEPLLWKPHITAWSLVDDHMNFGENCKFIGEGDFFTDWFDGSSYALKSEASEHAAREALCKDELKFSFVQKGRIVSSTMVVSQIAHIPYAVVYGYHSGEIELVRFEILTKELVSDGVDTHPKMEPQGSKQQFSGHTGAVLCLAAHQMVYTSTERNFRQVLLSGSMDCTVRLWDLETCNPIMVMHHHVAPVRQIILPPLLSKHPWNDCFLSVGEDSCVALVSIETLRVERMFPGHTSYPSKVVWDGTRGYLACLSQNRLASGGKDVLYIWDIRAGSRERILRGKAAYSMFDNFCKVAGISLISGCASNYNTSSSSLVLPLTEDRSSLQSHLKNKEFISCAETNLVEHSMSGINSSRGRSVNPSQGNHEKLPIRCSSPISGIAILSFDIWTLISPGGLGNDGGKHQNGPTAELQTVTTSSQQRNKSYDASMRGEFPDTVESHQTVNTFILCLLRFSLSLLHLWGVDYDLDNLLMMEMDVKRYEKVMLAPGLEGDRGSITLAFPAFYSTLQLWKSSSEFCALRSLTTVSLAQSMVSLSHSFSGASSALSAFYTRNLAEIIPDVKPPSLQLLVSFWQDEDEHIRLAARSLFHCAASRAIPPPLSCHRATNLVETVCSVNEVRGSKQEFAEKIETNGSCLHAERPRENQEASQEGEAEILKWLQSYEMHDWISFVGGTSQDAMASHIIVAAALAIWYPSLVKPSLPMLVVHPLMKLVMAVNEKYSSTAAELLAEGMDSTWKPCIGSEIPHLIGDIFFQIECVSGASTNYSSVGPAVPPKLYETLVGVLLPSLALADIPGFLSEIEGLIWSTASDSPVHLVSLKTLIRVIRGSPRHFAQYLNKVVNFILQTMDPANSVMRRTCLLRSMTTLREVARVYPMVALNESLTRLAVGDAVAEVNNAHIHVYDMQSVTKIKILDASGPLGLPTLLSGAPETVITAISALSFSPDGEGLVAFSEHGLIIRWWSLGSAWWEKLSHNNFVPVQCTKLILVPPWEGFSPNSSRASLMANISGNGRHAHSQDHKRSSDMMDSLNILLHNLDLSYRLEWVGDRKLLLTRRGHELATFLL